MKAYLELAKPRITIMLLVVALASFVIASPRGKMSWSHLSALAAGIVMLAGGIFALNQYIERETDQLMARTQRRPLPSGRLSPRSARVFGTVLTAAALILDFLLLGWVAAALALFTFTSYIFVYTPLKRRTEYHTALGALSGAVPPLLGWAAARGGLDTVAWLLSAILFLWQFPHFLAIEMIYRDEYARAGIRVLPVVDTTGRAASMQILVALALLLCASVLPWVIQRAGRAYFVGSIVAGAGFLACGVRVVLRRDIASARYLLRASVAYLPVIFGLMVIDSMR